ncbi:hypothetical protein SEPCBS119000_005834 [Sporothrix epigloea]|uniref:EVE domain-containing protein n=1 Tax=Sporothrix epigloea TaxID=1892477 RepID=A0ABP0E3P9_9PEZI
MPLKRTLDAEAIPLRRSSRTRRQLEPDQDKESQPHAATNFRRIKKADTATGAAKKPTSKETGPRDSGRPAGPTVEASLSTRDPAAAKRTDRIAAAKIGKGEIAVKENEAEELAIKNDVAAEPLAKFSATTVAAAVPEADGASRQYWLLKAEPESRFENGIDVRFSIDDLAACTEPEPWDGIRNYAARNNLRQMKKGDLAFFYHSNTKEPGIVGTMTIVQEHSPDLTAHDPATAYYDPRAAADAAAGKEPKWSVVHVEFRSKFAEPITLRDLKALGGPGQPLDKMQMLKQSRLSVSRVSATEWEHLMAVAKES